MTTEAAKRVWCKILSAPSTPLPEPEEWGHRFWYTMNAEALAIDRANTPESTDKQRADVRLAVRASIEAKMYTLPCERCQNHFTAYVRDHPIDDAVLASSASVGAWLRTLDQHIRDERKREEEAAAAEEKARKDAEARAAAARSLPTNRSLPIQPRSIAPRSAITKPVARATPSTTAPVRRPCNCGRR